LSDSSCSFRPAILLKKVFSLKFFFFFFFARSGLQASGHLEPFVRQHVSPPSFLFLCWIHDQRLFSLIARIGSEGCGILCAFYDPVAARASSALILLSNFPFFQSLCWAGLGKSWDFLMLFLASSQKADCGPNLVRFFFLSTFYRRLGRSLNDVDSFFLPPLPSFFSPFKG